jgi:predicted small lipoprotein YifL
MRWAPVALALIAFAGCGGEGKRKQPNELPAADRVAFYQLATVDGLLRTPGRSVDAQTQLAGLAPHDPSLKRLREELAGAASAAAAGRRAESRQALELVYRGLLRYQRAHPALAGLVPD